MHEFFATSSVTNNSIIYKNLIAVKEDGVRWPAAKRGTTVRGTKGWDLAMLAAIGQAREVAPGIYVA